MKNEIIYEWFRSWFDSQWNNFYNIFEDDIYYSESWGPEYYGIEEIKSWVMRWHTHSQLIEWNIKKIDHIGNISYVEWFFCCRDQDGKHEFNGISVIEWGNHNKIKRLKEFGSSLPKNRIS